MHLAQQSARPYLDGSLPRIVPGQLDDRDGLGIKKEMIASGQSHSTIGPLCTIGAMVFKLTRPATIISATSKRPRVRRRCEAPHAGGSHPSAQLPENPSHEPAGMLLHLRVRSRLIPARIHPLLVELDDALVRIARHPPEPGQPLDFVVDPLHRFAAHEPNDFHIRAIHRLRYEPVNQTMIGIGKKMVGQSDIKECHTAIEAPRTVPLAAQVASILAAAYGAIGQRRAQAVDGLLSRQRLARPSDQRPGSRVPRRAFAHGAGRRLPG